MINEINGYKQHLWSLFQSYSYILTDMNSKSLTHNNINNGTFQTRRLSESGYRAIMGSIAIIDIIDRFFPLEDEITQREALRRLESERFKEEVWDEMLHASAWLLDSVNTGINNITLENNNNNNSDHNDIFSDNYDYEVMCPTTGHDTVNWTVFSSVLILHLSSSLHFTIEENILQECRETLQPPVWLAPSQSSRITNRISETQSIKNNIINNNNSRGSSDEQRPTTTAIQLSPLESLMEPAAAAPPPPPPPHNILTNNVSAFNNNNNIIINNINMQKRPVLGIYSEPFASSNKEENINENSQTKENNMSHPNIINISISSNKRTVIKKKEEKEKKKEFEKTPTSPTVMKDNEIQQSSPPPRPKHSTVLAPIITPSPILHTTPGVRENRGINMKQLRERLAARSTEDIPLLSKVKTTVDINSVAYRARYDAEINKCYNERYHQDLISSPSPDIRLVKSETRIIAPILAEEEEKVQEEELEVNSHKSNEISAEVAATTTTSSIATIVINNNINNNEMNIQYQNSISSRGTSSNNNNNNNSSKSNKSIGRTSSNTEISLLQSEQNQNINNNTNNKEEEKEKKDEKEEEREENRYSIPPPLPPSKIILTKESILPPTRTILTKKSVLNLLPPNNIRARQLPPPKSPSRRAISRVKIGTRTNSQPIIPRTRAPLTPR